MAKFTKQKTSTRWKLNSYALLALSICCWSFNVRAQVQKTLQQYSLTKTQWQNGNEHTSYNEGNTVPYRLILTGLNAGTNVVTINFDITGTSSSPVNHAIDRLGSYNAFVNFDGSDAPVSDILGGTPFEIGHTADELLAGGYPFSTGTLYIMGGAITNLTVVPGDDTKKNSTTTATINFNVTDANGNVVIYWGGHLALDADYPGDDNGSGGIHGSPYHMRLLTLNGQSAGHHDRSVRVGLAECNDLPVPGDGCDLYECETTAGAGTAHFNLQCPNIGTGYNEITWYDHNGNLIADPTDYVGTDGEQVYAILSNDCGNSDPIWVTLHVNPLPTFGTTTPYPTCWGTSNGSVVLSTCQSGVSYQLQTCSGTNVGSAKNCAGGPITWTGLAAGSYKILATNTNTGCTNTSSCVTVVGAICDATLTQGFYGNYNGKDCNNKTAIQIMQAAVGASKLFGNGSRSFTLYAADLTNSKDANIFKMLPGGGTPAVLKPTTICGGTASYGCSASWPNVPIQASGPQKGNINNTLLAQTMALFFNTKNSATLKDVVLTGNVLTFNNLNCGSSTPGSYASTQTIPCSVFNYLNNTSNYSSATISNLLDLANKVLGGVSLNGGAVISAADMTAALDAINVGFDKGKALVNQAVDCSAPVTMRDQVTAQAQLVTNLAVTAYPNPYTNRVNFTISSPVAGKASLQVFNELGQNVKTVFSGYLQAGQTQNVSFDVPPAMQSLLIYRLQVGDQQITGKVVQAKQ
jgi:hypothetical protein